MYCRECGVLYEAHWKFCKECGSTINNRSIYLGNFWVLFNWTNFIFILGLEFFSLMGFLFD